jgi:L-glutamine-phosphate cytidylyltransferase
MKAIILSAGQGRRLLPLTADKPKSALPVGARSLLEWQLHEMAQCAIDDVVVVTGFAADVIDDIVARQCAVPTRTLYNPFFAQCDNLGTCWVARGEMQGDFIIVNGDTLFEAAILRRLLDSESNAAVTLVTDSKASYDDDDMKVIVANGRLQRVGKHLDRATVNGESIGMMAFRGEGPARFAHQLEHMMRHGTGLKQWYLAAVDKLADHGLVATCPIDGLSWCEVDDSADLERAAGVIANWYPQRSAPTGTAGRVR